MFKKYLEIATKEKKAEGLWSNGKPESQEKDMTQKVRLEDLPEEVQDNIILMKRYKLIVKKNPQAEMQIQQNRLVLYDGNFYAGKAEDFVHDYIVSWMMLNAGLKISERQFENWHKIPINKFFCLQQYSMNLKYIGLSESYTDASIKVLQKYKEKIGKAIDKIYPDLHYVHAKISNYWIFDQLIKEENKK